MKSLDFGRGTSLNHSCLRASSTVILYRKKIPTDSKIKKNYQGAYWMSIHAIGFIYILLPSQDRMSGACSASQSQRRTELVNQ